MSEKHRQIAKITRPTLPDVFPRKRLFSLLDQSRRYPVTWISGPAGSGKTTLVASYLDDRKLPCLWYQVDEGDADVASFFYYLGLAAKKAAPGYKRPLPLLTPEYALGIPTFTRRYFENLCSRLKPQYILVFDNYQEISAESAFHEIFRTGLSALPENITAISISRSEPPAAFAGMLAGSKLHVIGWSDLKLTPEESECLVRLQGVDRSRCNLSEWMHEKTQGWAAGLVLLTRAVRTEGLDPDALRDLPPEKVFDYFANELFDRLDKPTQDFLLKTANPPKITPHVAAELTGNKHAGQLLSELNRRNHFTEKRQQPELSYQYHALFREFLLTRTASMFPSKEVARLRLQSAKLLEQSGQIEDAAEIYLHAQEWPGLIGLIMKHAPELMKQARAGTLGKWLAALPEEMVVRDPWLLYWSGACRMPFNPGGSQRSFEKAFHLFNTRKDAVGTFLSWAGVVNCIAYAMEDITQFDHWVSVLDRLLQEYGGFPTKEVEGWVASAMVPAISLRQPDNPDFDSWKSKALSHEETKIHTLFQLAFFYMYRGDLPQANQMRTALYRLAKAPGASPLGLIMAKLLESNFYILFTEDPRQCIRATQEGLTLSEKSGVRMMDFMMLGNAVVAALLTGELPSARSLLQQMAASAEIRGAWDRAFYNFVLASEALFVKDLNRALRHAEEALRLVVKVGVRLSVVWCYYLNALVKYESGDIEAAQDLLGKGFRESKMLASALTKHEYHFIKAYFALNQGKRTLVHTSLKKAMTIGREKGVFTIHPPIPPAMMFSVCAEALEAEIEVEYVQKLIRLRNVVPETPPLHVEAWPWPVRIYTLGGFRLLLNDKPVVFSGKAQKKPLEMLKALVALGGSDIRESQLTDALWPEAEGDAASTAFRTTLHRLRRLVGNETVVAVRDGRVNLDPRYCWTDVWAFERMLQNADCPRSGRGQAPLRNAELKERKTANQNKESAIKLFERAVALYRGHFLIQDSDKPWVTFLRERLQSKFLRAVDMLGQTRMSAGRPEKALECYQKGLETDDLAEEFYRGLMSCHLKLGRKADAVKAYRRCRNMLQANLGVEPSVETEELYKKIIGRR